MYNNQFNEKDYIQGIVNGEKSAFKKIFLTYFEPLCNFCWRYTKSKAISKDIVQETFADLWNLRDTLDPNRSIRVYLYQAVKNKALDYLDHQKVVWQFQKEYEDKGFVRQERTIRENEKFIKVVRQAIDNLPHRAQQAYILNREDGLTYKEIAKVMNISVKTVESQISRALDILRSQLRDELPDRVTNDTLAKIFSIRSTGTD